MCIFFFFVFCACGGLVSEIAGGRGTEMLYFFIFY